MKNVKLILATVVVCFVALPLAALCQQSTTVGELLDKGGKKLTTEEIVKLVTGATVIGLSMNNPNWKSEYTYKADGSVGGYAVRMTGVGATVRAWGKWRVSEEGQLCTDRTISTGGSEDYCDHYFSLGGRYYSSRATDRAAPVFDRDVKR